MKTHFLELERVILRAVPVRWVTKIIIWTGFRIRWFWGRMRFGVLVQDRGTGCVCSYDAELKYPQNISLGRNVVIGQNVSIGARSAIRLDDFVRISRDVIIETSGLDFRGEGPPFRHASRPITIGEGAWIGARSIILGGVTIGARAVVAAGSVVTKSIGDGQIVAGVPARPVKNIDNAEEKNG